jgi:hypothetical protein
MYYIMKPTMARPYTVLIFNLFFSVKPCKVNINADFYERKEQHGFEFLGSSAISKAACV